MAQNNKPTHAAGKAHLSRPQPKHTSIAHQPHQVSMICLLTDISSSTHALRVLNQSSAVAAWLTSHCRICLNYCYSTWMVVKLSVAAASPVLTLPMSSCADCHSGSMFMSLNLVMGICPSPFILYACEPEPCVHVVAGKAAGTRGV